MNLKLLLADELAYFIKARVMLYLWVGIPLVIVASRFASVGKEGPGSALFGVFMASSLFGMTAGTMLTASVIGEIQRGVFVLFAVRPVRRRDLLFAKFLSVFIAMLAAFVLSLGAGLLFDAFGPSGTPGTDAVKEALLMFCMSVCFLGITSALGVLVGTLSASMQAGIIVYFILNSNAQVFLMMLVEKMMEKLGPGAYLPKCGALLGIGLLGTGLLLWIAIRAFEKKQL